MTLYKLSREELESFARKVYEEACYGYLDLKDSVCGSMVNEFLDGRAIVPPLDTNVMSPPSNPSVSAGFTMAGSSYHYNPSVVASGTISNGYMGHGMITGIAASPGLSDTLPGTVTISGDTSLMMNMSLDGVDVPESVATGRDNPLVTGFTELRIEDAVRSQDEVRPEQNFQGNESERF